MKALLNILFLFSINILIAQSNWQNGYVKGYKIGSCNGNPSCVGLYPSLIPVSNTGSFSYEDGFAQGAIDGKKASNNNGSNNPKGYIGTPAEFIDNKMNSSSVDNANLMKSMIDAVDNRIDNNLKYRDYLIDWTLDLKLKTNDKEFLSDIDAYYNTLIDMNPEEDYLAFSKKQGELDEIKQLIKYRVYLYNMKLKEIETNSINNSYNNQTASTSSNYKLGIDNYKSKNYPEAIKYFTIAINNNEKNYTNLYCYRALVKTELGDRIGAIEDYDIAIKNNYYSNFGKATVLNNKAFCLLGLKRYKEALPLVNLALNLEKKYWYIWDTRGELNYKLGLYNECKNDMTNAINLQADGNSYLYRGLANIMLKRKSEGCKDLSKSGELGTSEAYTQIKKYCK
ncbi:NrfG FOG, TPR repeat [Flavobacteriaceae bacterium]